MNLNFLDFHMNICLHLIFPRKVTAIDYNIIIQSFFIEKQLESHLSLGIVNVKVVKS